MSEDEVKLQIALGTLNYEWAMEFIMCYSSTMIGSKYKKDLDYWIDCMWFAPFYLVEYCIQRHWIKQDMLYHLLIHNSVRDKIYSNTLVEYNTKKRAAESELFVWQQLSLHVRGRDNPQPTVTARSSKFLPL